MDIVVVVALKSMQ